MRKLRRRGRLARALQANQQHDLRPAPGRAERGSRLSEQRQQLIPHDADNLLRRGQAVQHLAVDGALSHAGDERLHDLEVDVRFQQRQAYLAQRRLNGGGREPHLASNAGEYVAEAVA